VNLGHHPPHPLRPPGRRQGPRIGSLCTGYGGLDIAVQTVVGGQLAWYAEVDRHACTVLAHRFPGIANLGDIRTVNWTQVAPVDLVTAGFPCQDYSE
jgi:DNA (cytosine-5)-methyltransferase 1